MNADPHGADPHGADSHGAPPSAAGPLEPYGTWVRLRPERDPLAATPFLKALLEGVAAGCAAAGATVIGHLKCVLHTEAGVVPCNLTSVRSGAVCRGGAGAAGADAAPGIAVAVGEEAVLDLVVLVYGVSAALIDEVVRDVLERILGPVCAHWAGQISTDPHS